MKTQTKTLPKGSFVVLFSLVYLLTQLVFLLAITGNMPLFRDIVDMTTPSRAPVAAFFEEFYLPACIIASAIQFVQLVLLVFLFTDKRWPMLITFVAILVNLLICDIAISGMYIIDLRDVYFTLQITFLIPIITIFLACVFIIDDTVDILRGKFENNMSGLTRSAQAKLDKSRISRLKASTTDEESERVTLNPNIDALLTDSDSPDTFRADEIARAAELVLPFKE